MCLAKRDVRRPARPDWCIDERKATVQSRASRRALDSLSRRCHKHAELSQSSMDLRGDGSEAQHYRLWPPTVLQPNASRSQTQDALRRRHHHQLCTFSTSVSYRDVNGRARPPWVHLAQADPQRFPALLGRRSGTPHFDTAMGRAHTCGMEVCHFIAVALTVAPLPAPRFFRRIQPSTSPRLA